MSKPVPHAIPFAKGCCVIIYSPTNPRIWKCRMGSLLGEEFSKAGGSSEKDSAIAKAIKTRMQA